MTLEERVAVLEYKLNRALQNVDEIHTAFDQVRAEIRPLLGDLDKTAHEKAVVQFEDGGCRVNLPTGGVIVINRF